MYTYTHFEPLIMLQLTKRKQNPLGLLFTYRLLLTTEGDVTLKLYTFLSLSVMVTPHYYNLCGYHCVVR